MIKRYKTLLVSILSLLFLGMSSKGFSAATQPFTCDGTLMQVVNGKLYEVNAETGKSRYLADLGGKATLTSGISASNLPNALAYNPIDGFIYFISSDNTLFGLHA